MPWDGIFEKKRAPKPNHNDGGSYCGQFLATNTNALEKDSPAYGIPLAMHHITDWELLRNVWNRMVTDKHWGTICCWLYAVGFNTNNIYKEVGETDKVQSPAAIVGAIMRKAEIQTVADFGEIHQRITWSAWNLVEGPKEEIRSDDKGNFHDTFSNVNGLEHAEIAAMTRADNVYTVMKSINLSSPVPKPKAEELSKVLLAMDRDATIIRLRVAMWTKAAGGKKCWSKNVKK